MRYNILVLALAAVALLAESKRDMNMDMDNHESTKSSPVDLPPSQSSDWSSLTPTAHKAAGHHGLPILQQHLEPEEYLYWSNYNLETYFNTPSSKRSALYLHLAFFIVPYIFLYPFVLMFANLKHRLYFPALSVHTASVVFSVINYWVFAASIRDDVYPGNAYHPMSYVLFFGAIAHWVLALISTAYSYLSIHDAAYFSVDNDAGLDSDVSIHSPDLTLRDSGSRSDSFELENVDSPDAHLRTSNGSMLNTRPSNVSQFFLRFPAFTKTVSVFGSTASTLTALFNWASFAYFIVYFFTGIATYFVYGADETMFNLLAHFIKGGVFFTLGLVSLARYCGAFQNKGWAWNHRFVSEKGASAAWLRRQPSGLWTMEFVESSLILFYGSTNIFLEHLAGAGGAWTAKDLQHASIAFIYIGCGLCGVLVEKKLSSWRYQKALEHLALVADAKDVTKVQKAHPGYSPNLFPILTIYWTGVLMSQHQQASHLSTEIHKQWGGLFVVGCAFRLMTYIISYLSPVDKKGMTKPSRPMTELVTSFALICGGMVFMESTEPVVHTFEYYGYTTMFTLNVSLGVVALIMAWEMSLFAIKDWLKSKKVTTAFV